MFSSQNNLAIPMLFGDKGGFNRSRKSSSKRYESFHELIRYIRDLRESGMIADDAFEELVKQASSTYIESEITDRVENAIQDIFTSDNLEGLFQ